MRRRARAVWLLDSTDPTGRAVMALRRIEVLRSRLASTPLALSSSVGRMPANTPMGAFLRASSLPGEVRTARADVVVTTSERTLANAAPRLRPSTRLLHFLHTAPEIAVRSERFMRTMPRITRLVVPAAVDPARFAQTVGLGSEQVVAQDDFTVVGQSHLGTATPRVVLAAGQLAPACGVLELAEGFRLALPQLPGWQLRVAGWGPLQPVLDEFADGYGLRARIQLLGPRYDLATEYLGSGVVVQIGMPTANGLPVAEALTAGIPVLGAPGVPAVRRLITDGVNGVVLHRTDPADIAEALVHVADPEVRSGLAHGARTGPTGAIDTAARRALLDFVDDLLDADITRTGGSLD